MKKHLMKCWLWKGLWTLGALSFIASWVSVAMQKPLLNVDPGLWLWSALILAALSIPVKLDCAACGTCNVGPRM